MFVERKINSSTGVVELWKCDWETGMGQAAKKVFIQKIGDEQPLDPNHDPTARVSSAICWSYGRTLGNIAVLTPDILGTFPASSGDDAILPCDFVSAGKFRHGANRWWCRTHQSHWGTKADQESYERLGRMICANHDQRMNYVVDPYTLKMSDYAEVGIWCSMPAALATGAIPSRPPKIHVHVRPEVGGNKTVDQDFKAIAIQYGDGGLFSNANITQVNVTPPAAFEFVRSLELGREMSCVNCSNCRYPHLDLGDFAARPHKKHFCANCGRDSTWSSEPIISTPLQPMHDQFGAASKSIEPDRTLNLDKFSGCRYVIWASTPAIIWTANRPQEKGIHVHVHDGTSRVVDDTFGEVILDGKPLDRAVLINEMMKRTII